MKVLIGQSANTMLIEADEGLCAKVELVLVVSEPKYIISAEDPAGFIKQREVTAMRFAASADQLLALAKSLENVAKAAKELESRAMLNPHADRERRTSSAQGLTQ
jgi:hypothetical protein